MIYVFFIFILFGLLLQSAADNGSKISSYSLESDQVCIYLWLFSA